MISSGGWWVGVGVREGQQLLSHLSLSRMFQSGLVLVCWSQLTASFSFSCSPSALSFSVVNILRGKSSSATITERSPLLRFSQDDRRVDPLQLLSTSPQTRPCCSREGKEQRKRSKLTFHVCILYISNVKEARVFPGQLTLTEASGAQTQLNPNLVSFGASFALPPV